MIPSVPSSWRVILLALCVHAAVLGLGWAMLLRVGPREGPFRVHLFGNVLPAWAGLLMLMPLLMRWGRLRLQDLGLRSQRLLPGLLWLVVLAACAQIVYSLLTVWRLGALPPANGSLAGIGRFLFAFSALALGPMLLEEVFFRGFLLPQLMLKLPGNAAVRTVSAVLLSSLCFAAFHVPTALLHHHFSGIQLAGTLAFWTSTGVFFSLLYLRTQNLVFVIGVHVLLNMPAGSSAADATWTYYLAFLPWLPPQLGR